MVVCVYLLCMINNVIRIMPPFIVTMFKYQSKRCLHRSSTLQQFLEMVIRFLAEGAASGLNVIAVYVTEILRVTGFDGRYQHGPCV